MKVPPRKGREDPERGKMATKKASTSRKTSTAKKAAPAKKKPAATKKK